MDSYQELCYEVGLDLEPNKYAKLRKQAMLAQEEQNDPMPWPLLFIDELCLKMKDKLRRGKKEELADPRPPRKMIRQIEDLDNLTKANGTSHDPDPYAIASAPDNHSPNRNVKLLFKVSTTRVNYSPLSLHFSPLASKCSSSKCFPKNLHNCIDRAGQHIQF